MKRLAILILNYNGQEFLKSCFDSLLNQTSKEFDIWLVDNNSTDNSRVLTMKKYPQVNIYNTKGNLGYTGAYNDVMQHFHQKKLSYEFYLFLNNDTIADKRMISTILNIFDKRKEAGIVVPAVVDNNMHLDGLGGKYVFWTGTTYGNRHGEKYVKGNSLYKCFWASGCCLAIRSSLIRKLGNLSDYFIYFEDVDISWRVNNAGFDVVSTDITFVKHLQGGSKFASSRALYLHERNRIISYWLNLPTLLFFFYLPILLLLRIGLLFYLAPSIALVKAKLKGNIDGILMFSKYKKRSFPMFNYIKTLRNMNHIINL